MAFILPAGAAGGSTVASNVRSLEWVLAQHRRPDRRPCFRQATAYVGSRRSRPCIRTMMPELMRLTIALPTISVSRGLAYQQGHGISACHLMFEWFLYVRFAFSIPSRHLPVHFESSAETP
jgi:hypothetical protein